MDQVRGNRMNTRLIALAALVIVSSGCSTGFDRQYAEVERLRVEAEAAGAEWLETSKLLAQAIETAAQDDMDAAFLLLDKARFQSEMAIKQAEHEADAWASRVVQ